MSGLAVIEPGSLVVRPDGSLPTDIQAWLVSQHSPNTREAYGRDIRRWLLWCAEVGLDPLEARRRHVEVWREMLQFEGQADSTIGRRLAAVSSMYQHLIEDELAERNPVAAVRRPPRDVDHAETPALTDEEAAALARAAARPQESRRTQVTIALLLTMAMRVSELVSVDIEDFGIERGNRVLRFTRKGRKRETLVVAPEVWHMIQGWVGDRIEGPLLATSTGGRMDRRALHRLVVRLAAAAGIETKKIGPHALRRTAATSLLDGGASIRDVQQLLGHATSRTTEGYDRSRKKLAKQAVLVSSLAATFYGEDSAT